MQIGNNPVENQDVSNSLQTPLLDTQNQDGVKNSAGTYLTEAPNA